MNYHEHRASRGVGEYFTATQVDERIQKLYHSPPVVKAFENICFIAELLKKKDRDAKVIVTRHFFWKVVVHNKYSERNSNAFGNIVLEDNIIN